MNDDIRLVRLDDKTPAVYINQLARIHREEIKEGFLSTLGVPFLRRLYHALVRSQYACVIAAVGDEQILGFICGSWNTGRIYREFLTRWGLLAAPVLLPKLLTFARLRKVLETLFYPSRAENQDFPREEILNFCVTAACQRKGVGKRLFFALMEEFRRRGVQAVKIVTGEGQKSARAFYESLGMSQAGEISIHGGSASFVYVYRIEKTC